MKHLHLTLTGALLTVTTALAAQPVTPTANLPVAPAAATTPLVPALRSGIDLASFDKRVRPQDDFYRFAGGGWLASNPLPADRSAFGSFDRLQDQAEAEVKAVVEAAALAKAAAGTPTQKIGDLYSSFMDTTRLAALGASPLAAELKRIDAIRGTRDLYEYMGRMTRSGLSQPMILYVGQDSADSSQYLTGVYQGGLTMPDRDYYLKPDKKYVEFRAAFRKYVEALLVAGGQGNAAATAKRIEALETRIANHHWTPVQNRDPVKTYNKKTLAELRTFAPTLDLQTMLTAARLPAQAVDINQPSYVRELAKMIRTTPLADWREYLRFQLLDSYAPYLSAEFDNLHFDFHRKTLRGVPEQLPRWKRALRTMDGSVGELIGQLYVERTFSAAAKEKMQGLIDKLLQAFAKSIDELEWMGPATKAEAHKKLQTFGVKIGYPDKWRDYSALTILPGDLIGNLRRASELEFDRQANKLGKPIDRTEWLMTPQTVNAYYYPPMNEIVFPAAILHPPFFDPEADDAANYGAIGAIIGHEISHGFDDQGRQFDGAGNLRDWWTFDDNARFRQRAGKLVAQFASFKVLDGKPVNGELTLGENIGDLSGLAVALKAYQLSLAGKQAPDIDGFTGLQRFFLGWAQAWTANVRDNALLERLTTDPHSPEEFRCNGPLSNLNEFYQAFDVKQGDKLYRAPVERVKIW
jgi:putative endopeptidase